MVSLMNAQEGIQQTVLSFPSVVKELEDALRRDMNTISGILEFTTGYLQKVRA